ncbi:hypothetical protein GE061_003789 [Apolygus lucorum]|uniref:Uncharacterized protein n=1 Tax=Apolygus lucorum TaxID=248454 RepID=A0A6A4JR76_APOLU|nr:hypothetical protein GE061_003789 [Apolygus lucorum]
MERIVEENKNLTQQLALERNQHKDLKSKLEAELFQLRTERQELLETLNSTKVELNAAKSNLANAEYLSKEATNRANVLQQDLTSKTTLLENLKSKMDGMKRFTEKNKDLTQQLALGRNQHKDMKSKLEAELRQLRTERQEFLETLNSTKVELNAAKSNLANAEYLSKEATNRANVLQQDLTSKTTLLENLKSKMDGMKRFAGENKDLTQQLALGRNQHKDMKSKLEAELRQLRTERQEFLETLNSTKVELNAAKSNLANAEYLSKEATNRANVLQQDLTSKTTLLENLKSKMDGMKRFAGENKYLTQQLALGRNQHKDMKSKLEAELRQLRTERQEFLETLNSTKVELNAAKSNLANAEYLSKEATNRANVLQQDLTSKTTLLENLKSKMDGMKRFAGENKDLTQQLALGRNQHKDMKSKLEAELRQLRTERQEFLETLNSTKVELNAAKSNLANAEYLSKEATNRANVLQQDLTSKTTLLENLKSKMDGMKRFAGENKYLTQQLALGRNQHKDMKSKLEAELRQLRTERQEFLETLNSTKVELNAAKSNLAKAERLSKEATDRAKELQRDLASRRLFCKI